MGASCQTSCRGPSQTLTVNELQSVINNLYVKKKYDDKSVVTIQKLIRGYLVRNRLKGDISYVKNRSDRYKNSNSTEDQVLHSMLVKTLRVPRPDCKKIRSQFVPDDIEPDGQIALDQPEEFLNRYRISIQPAEPDSNKPTNSLNKRMSHSLGVQQNLLSDLRRRFSHLGNQHPNPFGTSFEQLQICFQPAEKLIGAPSVLKPIHMTDGSCYQGQWMNQLAHGKGIYTFPDGSQYEGEWVCGKAYGRGTFRQPNGDRYEGDWVNGCAVGQGIYIYANGTTYQGSWRNDQPYGFGRETYKDGSYYEGLFVNGMKHGSGILVFSNGEMYQGEFYHDHMHGQGIFIWPDSRKYEGQWKNSLMDGKGVLTFPNGSRYEGEYKNDKKHGFGTYTNSDGSCYTGNWYMGRQHGDGEFTNIYGVTKQGVWTYGKLQSKSTQHI